MVFLYIQLRLKYGHLIRISSIDHWNIRQGKGSVTQNKMHFARKRSHIIYKWDRELKLFMNISQKNFIFRHWYTAISPSLNVWAWAYCGANRNLKFLSLALSRCKSNFQIFEFGLIAVRISLALLPCISVIFMGIRIFNLAEERKAQNLILVY